MSSGERTSLSVPHLNNSEIIFCLGTGSSFKVNHIVHNPVCGSPFSLYLLSNMASKNGGMPIRGKCGHHLMTGSIFWGWWLDRQLLNRVFSIRFLKVNFYPQRQKKINLSVITFYSFLSLFDTLFLTQSLWQEAVTWKSKPESARESCI